MRYLMTLIITMLLCLLLVACNGGDGKTDDELIIENTTVSTDSIGVKEDKKMVNCSKNTTIDQSIVEYFIQINNEEFNLNEIENFNDLRNFDDDSLALLRNSIYAKYGYEFKSEKYIKIFAEYEWYEASDDFSETLFLDEEIKFIENIKLIEYQRRKKEIENTIVTFNNEDYRLLISKEKEAIDSLAYNRIEIFSVKTGRLLFDTNSFDYYDGDTIDGSRNYEIVEEYGLLHFSDYAYASDLPKQLLLTLNGDVCEIVFFDNFSGMKWIDIDGNGKNELYGYIYGGGQVSYDYGFQMAFEYIDGKGFVIAPELARAYEMQVLEEAKTNFTDNPSIVEFENLLCKYAYLGMKEECNKLREDNKVLNDDLFSDDYDSENWRIDNIDFMSEYYKSIWEEFS